MKVLQTFGVPRRWILMTLLTILTPLQVFREISPQRWVKWPSNVAHVVHPCPSWLLIAANFRNINLCHTFMIIKLIVFQHVSISASLLALAFHSKHKYNFKEPPARCRDLTPNFHQPSPCWCKDCWFYFRRLQHRGDDCTLYFWLSAVYLKDKQKQDQCSWTKLCTQGSLPFKLYLKGADRAVDVVFKASGNLASFVLLCSTST